jgi:hypothetical protein
LSHTCWIFQVWQWPVDWDAMANITQILNNQPATWHHVWSSGSILFHSLVPSVVCIPALESQTESVLFSCTYVLDLWIVDGDYKTREVKLVLASHILVMGFCWISLRHNYCLLFPLFPLRISCCKIYRVELHYENFFSFCETLFKISIHGKQ